MKYLFYIVYKYDSKIQYTKYDTKTAQYTLLNNALYTNIHTICENSPSILSK